MNAELVITWVVLTCGLGRDPLCLYFGGHPRPRPTVLAAEQLGLLSQEFLLGEDPLVSEFLP